MQLHGTLLTLYMTLLPWEICMVMYIKKKKETSHDIQCGKWRGFFVTHPREPIRFLHLTPPRNYQLKTTAF